MNWTKEEINAIFQNRIETKSNDEAWIILINGERYKTGKGKSVWKKRNHASSAFRNDMEWLIQSMTKTKLGIVDRYSTVPEYKYAFENFRDQLISEGILKLVQINNKKTDD